MVEGTFQETDIETFRAGLRAAVRGLWSGALTANDFVEHFMVALERGLHAAWEEGMQRYGVAPEDYSDAEKTALSDFITRQKSFVPALMMDIRDSDKASGKALGPLLARVEMWANRYGELKSIALTMAGQDESLLWQGTPGKAHCPTCYALIGWVKRASYWAKFRDETGIYPHSPILVCSGVRCGCGYRPTRMALWKGRPPVVLG